MNTRWGGRPSSPYRRGPRGSGVRAVRRGRHAGGLRLEDIVTEGFARDRHRSSFLQFAPCRLLEAKPNAAHDELPCSTRCASARLIVTRNIDDFHERAGSKRHPHPRRTLKARAPICTRLSARYADTTPASGCPVCGNKGHLRPHVVWVGEEPLAIARVYEALAQCRLLLTIGVAGGSEPARSFLAAARRAGARTIEFPGASSRAPGAEPFDECVTGPLAETVPAWVKKLIAQV